MKTFVMTHQAGCWKIVHGCAQQEHLASRVAEDYAKANPGEMVILANVVSARRGLVKVTEMNLTELEKLL